MIRMLILITKAVPTILRFASPYLGRLVTPRHYRGLDGMVAAGIPWAADNDAFSGFDEPAFVTMLDALAGRPGCRFVTAPDVPGDAAATLRLFEDWSPRIRARGLPAALAAQNGLEHLRVPWDDVDALFIGGIPEHGRRVDWKLSAAAAALVGEARARGKWAHMGRVNGGRRLEYAKAIGCGSVDGSSYARWTDANLPAALLTVAAPAQGVLS